ncbi:MAG: hypothetical protein HOO86_00090 [Bacteroidales bacterium]|nr:hypothetical protein [Bacteroidales bacterium]
MIRNILAILSGIVFGMLAIGIFESIGHTLFPVPQDIMQTAENQDTEALFALISPQMLLFVLLAYLLGSFFGGLITSLISKRIMSSIITGGVIMLGGVINLFMIPHPMWFILVSFVVFIPFAFIAGYWL